MDKTNFEKQATEIITGVKHPAIDNTLFKLGIVRAFEINGENVKIVMALPSLGIPILDMLVQSLQNPLEKINAKVDIKLEVMTREELQKFLYLEQIAWKGM
jgi:metal-sulfur cluster biosynthetic enzyme